MSSFNDANKRNAPMTTRGELSGILEEGEGILRLAPTWVSRTFVRPGFRLKLDPRDYFALGAERGGISERWLSSTAATDNGALTLPNQGISQVVARGKQLLFTEFVGELAADLIGKRHMKDHGGWTAFAKVFDTANALPFHFHLDQKSAAAIGKTPKPESYFFPTQLNSHGGRTPVSYLGLQPGTTKEAFVEQLSGFSKGNNEPIILSQAYKLRLGMGWDIPPGVLHAPGSLCTYEPQGASDVAVMCESVADGEIISEQQLWRDVLPARRGDYSAVVEMLDWDLNVDPLFAQRRAMPPLDTGKQLAGAREEWISYRSAAFSATQLTVDPGASVTVRDAAPYGVLCVQGHGRFGRFPIESPALIRFGAATDDEYFVSEARATEGVRIVNESGSEPLVLLKQFGPGNPDLKIDPDIRVDALGRVI
jgi:hypothetical protein